MKKKPLISIIITYHKKKDFIKRTLKSIFCQTYKNFEIIFVFDEDDNKDVEYLKLFLIKFKKKKIIINKKNLGVAKSRNLAIKHSKGEYLAFIDLIFETIIKTTNFMEKNFIISLLHLIQLLMKMRNSKQIKVNSDANYLT